MRFWPGSAAIAAAVLVLPSSAAAQDARQQLDRAVPRMGVVKFEPAPWGEALAYRAGDGRQYWWTSNAAYAAGGGEPRAFGTAWVWGHGGTSLHGCLFAETDDGPSLQWVFFQAWDPAAQALLSYQATGDGAIGVGHETPALLGGTAEMEQTFRWPDGSTQRMRHLSEHVHQDTMVTRSFSWEDGEWTPRRTYTWVRRPGDPRELCPVLP